MKKTAISNWMAKAKTAEKRGDLVVASELVTQGLASHPHSLHLRYLAARLLARSGATIQAADLYRRFGLDRKAKLDIAALGARIAKDNAIAASTGRRKKLRGAAAMYGRLYARTLDQYPAINAATLYLLSGDRGAARRYARCALEAGKRASTHTALDRYYRSATRAEAELIFANPTNAQQALREAARHLRGDFAAAATTRKQLRLVCRATRTNPDVLDVIRPPSVLHYYGPTGTACGMRGLPRDGGERRLTDAIADQLVRSNIGIAFGSLSAGGEILCAEACLKAGVELNIVFPFNEVEFAESEVRTAGPHWVRRFKECLRRAKSVTFATTDSYQGDDDLFTYACRLGMGLATLRARHLDAAAVHLRCQTGRGPDPKGYAASLMLWRALGHASHALAGPRTSSAGPQHTKTRARAHRPPPRFSRAIVFGDMKGFSRIPDHLIPVFQKRLMGAIAFVLKRYRRHVLYRSSWGDAIYVVIDDPQIAAECCLEIQDAIANVTASRYGLPSELALRLAIHFGPVYDGYDPIRAEPLFFGAHTTIAARMEPVTPPGQVYVTEAMAAMIAMTNASHLHVEHVGMVPMAKGYGPVRMYCLNRSAGAPGIGRRPKHLSP